MEEQIIRTEYADVMQKSYIDYAMSVIVARALPDVRDGLKPVQRRTLYEQMVIEQEAIKELLLYIYRNKGESGVFRLLNDMAPLELDDALINEYLADLCEGRVNDMLIDYVDELHEEIEDRKRRKERKELLSLIGDRSVIFDC